MRLALLLLAASLLFAAGAAGAPAWLTAVSISGGDRALGPELALNGSGDALVVWDQEVGADCPTMPASPSCVHVVTASARGPGSTSWGPPLEIARPGVGARPV